MDAGTTLVADRQAPKAVESGHGALDDPPRAAQPAPVRRPALGQGGRNAAVGKFLPMARRPVCPVTLDEARFGDRPPDGPGDGWHGVDQRQQLPYVMSVRSREVRDERNPLRVGKNMTPVHRWCYGRNCIGVRCIGSSSVVAIPGIRH